MAWKPGESGNAKGRKPGLTARGKFRKQVESALPEIVANVLQSALAGDMQAVKLILDRTIPTLKQTDEHVKLALPALLAPAGEVVIQAMADGSVSPAQAQSVMAVLSGQRALVEQTEVLQRLEAVEAWLQEKR